MSERGKSPAKSLAAGSIQEEADRGDIKSLAGKSGVSFKDEVEQQEDDFRKALATLERVRESKLREFLLNYCRLINVDDPGILMCFFLYLYVV